MKPTRISTWVEIALDEINLSPVYCSIALIDFFWCTLCELWMNSLDLRGLEDVVDEVSGWAGIGLPPMHLSIKLSQVILMNMKYKAKSSWDKLRDGVCAQGCKEVNRECKRQSLCTCGKFSCVVCLMVMTLWGLTSHLRTKTSTHGFSFLFVLGVYKWTSWFAAERNFKYIILLCSQRKA